MTRAAENLHVSQPTLSKQLRKLEEELGKQLFIRHSFSIELTKEGMLLRKRAEDIVAMSDKVEAEFLAMDDIVGGNIYFGCAESYQIRHLAKAIKTFKRCYPQFHYHITSGDTQQVLERLDIFSKDGGYVFDAIHVIQGNVPTENIVAMIDAVHEFNGDR